MMARQGWRQRGRGLLQGQTIKLFVLSAVFGLIAWFFWPIAGGGQIFLYISGFIALMAFLQGLYGLESDLRILRRRREAMRPSGAFGAARFASWPECQAAGLDDPEGLFLGALGGRPLFHNGKAHLLTVAPARQGKGIAVVIPNLLHWQGSVFVTDPKGELAGVTARHRAERFGQKVYVVNPWGLHQDGPHPLPQHRFNPLQGLIEAAGDARLRRGLMDEAAAIALQLLPEPDDARNRYFREGARKILRALLLHLATRGDCERCTLVEMWRILQSVSRLQATVIEMAGSDALDGTVADLADDLSHTMADDGGQFADFREGAGQAVAIFDPVGWLGESVSGSDFSFGDLKAGGTTVYLVIPQDKVETHGAWLGLLARQAITAVAAGGRAGGGSVLFLLDEFANMGKLAGLTESLTALPGLGVRVWAIVQELADLRRVYGPHATQTILSQAEVKQFFAVQNADLARELSFALGERTVKTMNYNLGRTEAANVGESVGETGRPLLSADEIRLLPRHRQLLLIGSLPPVLADRLPFWTVDPWGAWADPNPVEGAHPRADAAIRLRYSEAA